MQENDSGYLPSNSDSMDISKQLDLRTDKGIANEQQTTGCPDLRLKAPSASHFSLSPCGLLSLVTSYK